MNMINSNPSIQYDDHKIESYREKVFGSMYTCESLLSKYRPNLTIGHLLELLKTQA